jgi:hypothetical protein
LEITSENPWKGAGIFALIAAESTFETFAELGETVALPVIAMAKAAKKAVNGGETTTKYALRQFQYKTEPVSKEIDEAYNNLTNTVVIAPGDKPLGHKILDDLNSEANK